MAGLYEPDLTGEDPNYLKTNDAYVIYETGQSIVFDGPVFAASITAAIQSTLNTTLVENVDWVYNPTAIDTTSIAKMKTYDPSFDAVLITSIQFIRPISVPITTVLNYQRLYPVAYKIAVSDNQSVTLTPDLIISMLNRINNVELLQSSAESVAAISTDVPKLLPIDLTGTASSNLIENEIASVNVLQNQNIIFPVNGAFYGNSVSIVQNDGSNTPLVENTDYQFYNLNIAKTTATSSTSGVFEAIMVMKPYVGPLKYNYQAFGGGVTLSDMSTIYAVVQSLAAFVAATPFVTVPGLPNIPAYTSLLNRVATVENQMRALVNAGSPTYEDATGVGTTVVSKIRSNDNNNHWWTIATLFTVAGSSQIITADRAHFRIRMANAAVSFDVFVNADLNIAASLLEIDSISVNQDTGFALNGAVRNIPIVMPQFRIIWNQGNTSGIALQIGVALPSLTETIAIEDLSGAQSCWLLAPALTSPTLPEDDTILLPDNVSIWDSVNQSSLSVLHMMPNKTGYLAWSGSLSLAIVGTDSPLTTILPIYFNLPDIKSIELVFNTSASAPILINVPLALVSGAMAGSAYIPSASPDGTPTLVNVSISVQNSTVVLNISPEIFYTLETSLTLVQAIVKLQ